jgi:exonuclease SbcC
MSLGYDPGAHEALRAEIGKLEPVESAKRRLDEALRLVEQSRDSVSKGQQAAGELGAAIVGFEQAKVDLLSELQVLEAATEDLSSAEAHRIELADSHRREQEALGRVSERISRCQQLEVLKKEREGVLSVVALEESLYRELAEAFGKKGVQALLIETAVPEIEEEANALLAKMTDSRMHLRFETQRETKRGDVLETLDINISDELGTRSYEMFSGGEAFRINFAVRIALSKMLARRAGAPLPTLIIDEGFGTQDSNGMEKVKEAITSIQESFEKILVITHMDDFRDAFPVRIDVIKTPNGSTVEVN